MSDVPMRVSARNRIVGTVTAMKECAVVTQLTVDIGAGRKIVSVISRQSAENMDLRPGKVVELVMKSTEVMIGVD